MPITELENIAEEFANKNQVSLLEAVNEEKVGELSRARFLRKAEGTGRNFFSLQYSKDYAEVGDLHKFSGDSLLIENKDYLLSINSHGGQYVIEATPKKIIAGVESARLICNYNASFDSCKPSVIVLSDDKEGNDALRELIKRIF